MTVGASSLYDIIDYQFKQIDILDMALTHKSLSNKNYERLEFLGDSILNYAVSSILYQEYPISEGKLSISRAHLVNKKILSHIGKQLHLDKYIKTSPHQRISPSLRADVVEAIIGAIYLDGGLAEAVKFIKTHFQEHINNINDVTLKDPKTRLQEWTHQHNHPLPKYNTISAEGKQHEKTYVMECYLSEQKKTEASGRTKQEASQIAANKLLKRLQHHE